MSLVQTLAMGLAFAQRSKAGSAATGNGTDVPSLDDIDC